MIRTRNAAKVKDEMNETASLADVFQGTDQLNLHWRNQPGKIPSLPSVPQDFCQRDRPDGTMPGAFDEELPCPSNP
jgi:hypothetical protein